MPAHKEFVTLDGVDYVVLPLNWEALEDCQQDINQIQEAGGNFMVPGVLASMLKLITASLRRGNPDITEAVVKRGLDISNAPDILAKVFSVSGFVSEGGDQATGGKHEGGTSKTST